MLYSHVHLLFTVLFTACFDVSGAVKGGHMLAGAGEQNYYDLAANLGAFQAGAPNGPGYYDAGHFVGTTATAPAVSLVVRLTLHAAA